MRSGSRPAPRRRHAISHLKFAPAPPRRRLGSGA
jgi:hypothetical protein